MKRQENDNKRMQLIERDPEYYALLQLYPNPQFDNAAARCWIKHRAGGTICDGDLRLIQKHYRNLLYNEEKSIPLPPTLREFLRRFNAFFSRTIQALEQKALIDNDWSEFGGVCPFFWDDEKSIGMFDSYMRQWEPIHNRESAPPPKDDYDVNWLFSLAAFCSFAKANPEKTKIAVAESRCNEAEWWVELSCSPNLYQHVKAKHPKIDLQGLFGLTWVNTVHGEAAGSKTAQKKTVAALINARRRRTTIYDNLKL